jgi:hypothetical protein
VLSLKKRKVLTYVLVYDQTEIIRKSLDFLTKFSDQLDIVVIENPSPSTPKIKKLVNRYGAAGKIKRYYLFEENIAANVFSAVLENERSIIKKHQFVMITDGDLTCSDSNWINEERDILKNNPSLFTCGMSLDLSNLPLKAFPEAASWLPKDVAVHDDYVENITGLYTLMFSSRDLLAFMDWFKGEERPFVDSTLHHYCYEVIKKKWARTKHAEAYHLTWDLYKDKNNAYTKLKTSKSHQETWFHTRTSGYSLKEY